MTEADKTTSGLIKALCFIKGDSVEERFEAVFTEALSRLWHRI